MQRIRNSLVYLGISAFIIPASAQSVDSVNYRDPYKWPFSANSIWNMPIGDGARYVHAGIQRSTARGMTIDEDVIVTMPGEKLMTIYENFAGWDRSKDRCVVEGDFLFAAPIPFDFIVSPSTWDGLTPNSGLAVVLPDGKSVVQTQPFAHCSPGRIATSKGVAGSTSIYGSGYYGAHGGSGLSAIGGTLRAGELTPGSGPIRHALKINLCGDKNLYYDSETKGYRWPATRADGAASQSYGSLRTAPPVKECRMGALLALPPWIDLDSLGFETEPARILAEAFRDYGAYIVDNTGWDVYALVTGWSPKGRFADEFEKGWGFSVKQRYKDSPWGRDMDRIFLNLYVVDNNSADSIGGGGERRAALAPPFLPTSAVELETDGTPDVSFTRPDIFRISQGVPGLVAIRSVAAGYRFSHWSLTSGNADIEDPLDPLTNITVDSGDIILRANFEVETFSLNIESSGNGNVTMDPDTDVVEYGTTVTLSATAESGYRFENWSGDVESEENPVNLTVKKDMSVVATFVPDVYTLNLTIQGNGQIHSDPDLDTYPSGTEVTLTAEADSGWHFTGWQGDIDGSSNPRTITLSGNHEVTAIFIEGGVSAKPSGAPAVQPVVLAGNPAGGLIRCLFNRPNTGSRILVFNITGRMVRSSGMHYGQTAWVDISDLPAGIYLVRINQVGYAPEVLKYIKQ